MQSTIPAVSPALGFFSFFMFFQVLFLIAAGVGMVFSIIAIWRLSTAHKAIAGTLKEIAENIKSKQ